MDSRQPTPQPAPPGRAHAGGGAAAAQVDPPSTLRIGPFELHQVVSANRWGVIFAAQDTRTPGARRAVGVLDPLLVSIPGLRESFVASARRAGQRRHPALARVYEADVHNGIPYIVSEWLDGHDAGQIIRRCRSGEPLPLRHALCLAHQATRAVELLHAAGGQHGRLALDKLFISSEGRFTLIGIGLPTIGHEVWPLPDDPDHYALLAPEQILGDPVGPPADLYALCLLSAILASGGNPLQRPTIAQTTSAVLAGDFRLRGNLARGCPALRLLVGRGVAADPTERHGSAAELADELVELLEAEGGPVPPAEWAQLLRERFRNNTVDGGREALQRQRSTRVIAALSGAPAPVREEAAPELRIARRAPTLVIEDDDGWDPIVIAPALAVGEDDPTTDESAACILECEEEPSLPEAPAPPPRPSTVRPPAPTAMAKAPRTKGVWSARLLAGALLSVGLTGLGFAIADIRARNEQLASAIGSEPVAASAPVATMPAAAAKPASESRSSPVAVAPAPRTPPPAPAVTKPAPAAALPPAVTKPAPAAAVTAAVKPAPAAAPPPAVTKPAPAAAVTAAAKPAPAAAVTAAVSKPAPAAAPTPAPAPSVQPARTYLDDLAVEVTPGAVTITARLSGDPARPFHYLDQQPGSDEARYVVRLRGVSSRGVPERFPVIAPRVRSVSLVTESSGVKVVVDCDCTAEHPARFTSSAGGFVLSIPTEP